MTAPKNDAQHREQFERLEAAFAELLNAMDQLRDETTDILGYEHKTTRQVDDFWWTTRRFAVAAGQKANAD